VITARKGTVTGENMQQRTYEVMFIIRPDMADEEADKLVSTLESNAGAAGAKVNATERWGKRKLAYDVRGFAEGNYVLLKVDADGKAIHEVERRLRVAEPVIKFITVRTDEKQKKLEKIAKLRSMKVKRSAVEAQQQQAAPEAAAAAESTTEQVNA
jgi:small subunit ribosomal protein S6